MPELAEETPISVLFATDPLHLTQTDLTRIVTKFRENRALYISQGKSSPRAAVPLDPAKKAEAKAKAMKLDLGDLGL